jgi:hypothetical protein
MTREPHNLQGGCAVKKFLKTVFILAFVLGGWALAAASLHVVRAPGTMAWGKIPFTVQLVPKTTLTFRETWVDTTHWTSADVAAHPAFKARLEQANKLYLIEKAQQAPSPSDAQASAAPTSSSKVVIAPAPAPASPAPATANTNAPKSIFDFSK